LTNTTPQLRLAQDIARYPLANRHSFAHQQHVVSIGELPAPYILSPDRISVPPPMAIAFVPDLPHPAALFALFFSAPHAAFFIVAGQERISAFRQVRRLCAAL
jgi:hypothetical protein